MYCDSRVVLSYLKNTEKRFSKFVTHRISSILKLTNVIQWHYVNTSLNPADIASRPQTPFNLATSIWFSGPSFLKDVHRAAPPHPPPETELPEMLKTCMATHSTVEKGALFLIPERVNSLTRAFGVMSCILKFCSKLTSRTFP